MFMFDEKLIEATKRRPVIYDPSNKSNRYVKLKEQAWTEIALELGTPVKRCKARWASLRDRFRTITKAQQYSLQNGIKVHTKWRYYESLSFLLDTSAANTNSNFEIERVFSIDQFQEVDCTSLSTKVNRLEEPDPIQGCDITKYKEEPTKNVCAEYDSTDMFFKVLARRIKAANLPPLVQMKVEADILNFTINQLEQIEQN